MFGATPEFEKWAAGFSGCDGGNPHGRIWLCGIEWGLKGSGDDYDPKDEFKLDVSSPPTGFTKPSDNSHPFNQKFLKLLAVMQGKDPSDYVKLHNANPLPFHIDSNLFKINVYPLAFKSDGDELWSEQLWRATGLATKSLYRAWCQVYRFPKIKSWVDTYSPQIIIATGSSYRTDYLHAFGGVEAIYANPGPTCETMVDGQKLEHLRINGGKTILVIVPFLGGRHGLNSDERITRFGKALRKLL